MIKTLPENPNSEARIYRFDEFSFDADGQILYLHAETVQLPPKTCELLGVFLENPGKLLSKDDLMNLVWKDTFVEEANLSHHIAVLRKSLGEAKNSKKFIQTIPRKGYRFVAPVKLIENGTTDITVSERIRTEIVEEIEVTDEPENLSPLIQIKKETPLLVEKNHSNRPKILFRLMVATLLIGIAAGLYFWFYRPPSVRSVAVLPFKSLTAEPTDDYLELGMADSLITKLSRIKKVVFRPTSSIRKFKDSSVEPAQAGKELGVDAVLEGWLQRQSDDRLKVSVQLVKINDGAIIWAESFDESLKNIQLLQDSISEKVTTALALELTGEERQSISKNYTRNQEAYRLYLEGRLHWYNWTADGWRKAAGLFQQAVDKDPDFALAYVGLGDAYGALGLSSPASETYFKSKESTLKALELDPNLAEAHATLGMIKFFYERDLEGARESFRHAAQLNPNSALVHDYTATFFSLSGKPGEAISESTKAVELDPLTPYMVVDLGYAYYFARQPDRAIEFFNRALELKPDNTDAFSLLTRIHEQKGQFAEAESFSEKILIATGKREAADELRSIFAAGGYRAVLTKRLEQLNERAQRGYVSPFSFAALYNALGDKNKALEYLLKAEQEKSIRLMYLYADPQWDSLRSEPEFQNLLRRLNFNPS